MERQTNVERSAWRPIAMALPLALLVVMLTVLLFAWQQSSPELSQAADPPCAVDEQPNATCGMSLGVELASETPDCVAGPPLKCTFAVGQPFVLTVNTDPAPNADISAFGSEILFPAEPELDQCDNTGDDDGDGAVNDGCLQVGPVGEGQCGNNTDDDPLDDGSSPSERRVNDGCPAVGPAEDALSECANALDDDGDTVVNDGCPPVNTAEQEVPDPPFCGNTVDDDGDGAVNDGCLVVGVAPETDQCDGDADDDGDGFVNDGCPESGGESETGDQCTNDTDDDGFMGFGDGVVNDGCPAVGDAEFDECGNSTDDDGDGFPNDGCPIVAVASEQNGCDLGEDDDGDGAPNDGCPQVGATSEVGSFCADADDDDGDTVVNDGCPLVAGIPEETGGQCANAVDDDGDGRVNDGCPRAGGLLWVPRAACEDEVQMVRRDGGTLAICLSFSTVLGGVGQVTLSQIGEPPLAPLDVDPNSNTTLLRLDFVCSVEGTNKLTLTAAPDFTDGAGYFGVTGAELNVKTVEQLLDLDADGIPEPHDVADIMIVICGEPSPPTPAPTATPTPCSGGKVPVNGGCGTPTPTPTATSTPTVTPTPTPCPTAGCPTPTPSPTTTASPAGPTATPTEAHPVEPDVTITKTDSADPVESEGKITYALLVRNLGLQAAENVEVKDILPAGATFLGPALGCSHEAGVVTCTLPLLGGYDGQPGGLDEETIHIQITAPKVLPDFERIVNEVWVSATNEPFENSGNNHDIEGTVVLGQGPDLTVEKTASPDFLSVGGTIQYKVTVGNAGPVAAEGVQLLDTLPPAGQATFVSASAGCVHASGVVTCDLGSLAPDAQVSIQIEVSVPDVTQDLLLKNQAIVSAANERYWDFGNNVAEAHTPVVALPPELTVSKSGPMTVLRSRLFSYTITLTNQGGGDALDVVLIDTLPVTLVHEVPLFEGASCMLSGGVVLTCDIPIVPANGGQTVITVNVRAPNATDDLSLENTVSVVDADEGLEVSSSVVTSVLACHDLNGDGVVALSDFLLLLAVLGVFSPDPAYDLIYDFNGDGAIALIDFLRLQSQFGQVC